MVELLDIYDDNMAKIGVKPRSEVHRDGDWHRVFQCWVIYRDASGTDYIIVQKRASDKDLFPNKLDISAAGHYATDETMQDGVREIREELGLDVRFDELIPLGVRITTARDGDLIDREFADVFFLICDQPLAHYSYQKEEIDGLISLNIDAALSLFSGEKDVIRARAIGLETDIVRVTKNDFIARIDNYYYKVMVLAKRCLNGEAHLVI